jgi:hypothetical protein
VLLPVCPEPAWAEPDDWAVAGEDCCPDPFAELLVAELLVADPVAVPLDAVSPPTGVVPGAGWAAGVLAGGVVVPGADCAQTAVASASANAASDAALIPLQAVLMKTPPPARPAFMPLRSTR